MRSAYRATIVHCLADPGEQDAATAWECFDHGVLVVEQGEVVELGPAAQLLPKLEGNAEVEDLSGKILVPGFIDCHVHYPQLHIIASYGEQLLDWLNHYAYPEEQRFADVEYARMVADQFIDGLLKNGTTTALVFATVHPHSADAIFEAAAARNMRLVAGKVLMDQHCPDSLRDDPESGYADSRALIERWHGKDRLGYAITPRFVLTSSEEQLRAAGRLAQEFPDAWLHTHLAENTQEVEAIAAEFPWSRSYLDVYDRFGLVRERSMFAHCLHLDDEDRGCMSGKGAAAAFCPSSNLFLGSGLFDLRATREAGIRTGLATDVGGGTSLSMLRTMSDAYKVLHLQDQALPPMRALYLATLGAAEALYLDDRIGNFAQGKEADFVVLDPDVSPGTPRRAADTASIAEQIFALMIQGDDRNVAGAYLLGRRT